MTVKEFECTPIPNVHSVQTIN